MIHHSITKLPALLFASCLLLLQFSSCQKEPVFDENSRLDAGLIQDSSLIAPERYLLSYKIVKPTEEQKKTPVIIVAHGFSATTFEWDELRYYTDTIPGVYVSQVLLGGHGRSYEAFKNSSWQDWQQPIIDEYNRLSNMGYTNINLAGSSTACPLILDMLTEGKCPAANLPKHVVFIDPIVIPTDKSLSLVNIAGLFISYVKTDLAPGEIDHWYMYRPKEALIQLQKLLNITRKRLEDGISLDEKTSLRVYKSEKDPSADPVSAVLLYNGIRNADGSRIDNRMVNSDLHVFTRLHGRPVIIQEEYALQISTFAEMISLVR